ncbi:MAG: homoserine kinase [Bacteroidetes bacterium]|nr:MAG: homoserine kinase [Bacteroidota bacterium]
MNKEEVCVFSPGTVSNIGPGFDLLGFALEAPGDEMIIRPNESGKLRLLNETAIPLPLDPLKNVAGVAARALLCALKSDEGFDLVFRQKIPPGSGIGSSAASCVAAVLGINALLGHPFETASLLPFAMEGEKLASGSTHADNVAPALLGKITLIRSYDPIDIKHIPYPGDLYCALVHPHIEIRTMESRKLIPGEISLKTGLTQCGNLAGLIAGLCTGDYELIGRSVKDVFAEPYRIQQVPDFETLRSKALEAGARGSGLSGSGPSVFSLCKGKEVARQVGTVMQEHFIQRGIDCKLYISAVGPGARRISN